ncbi:MAG: RHS repeat protein [Chitinispirillaceae bacterium]|nr:RHS repeat protein [Chitinispirillaceae bacterium]
MVKGKVSAGHPVDVATGEVYSTQEDIYISGKVPLIWERRYSTNLRDRSLAPLGPGWTTRYFATITKEEKRYRFLTPEGEVEYFDDPDDSVDTGGIIRNLSTFQELSRVGYRYMVTRWNVETGEIVRFVFREAAPGIETQLASIEDITGQALDLMYDYHGRLTGIQQRIEKRRLTIFYTAIDRIEKVCLELSDGQYRPLVQYGYNESGCLAAAQNSRGFVDRFEYDNTYRMTREIVKDGGVFFFDYDEQGRCIKTSGLDRYDEKSFKYFDHIGWTEVTDSRGFTTRYQRLPSSQVICEVNPVGGKKETEYDGYGRIVKVTDANGGMVVYEFDAMGNRSKVTDQLGNTWEITFNDHHRPIKLTAPTGGEWVRKYDEMHRLIETINPLGARWKLLYDQDGNLVSCINPLGANMTQSFSANGILQAITDPLGHMTHYGFDDQGRLIEKVGPEGDLTNFEYDASGNLLKVVYPNNVSILFEYDSNRNLTKYTNGERRETRYRYGPCKRLLEKTDPNGNCIRYEWGTEPKQLERVINEKGEVFVFERDGSGRIIREVGFDGQSTSYEYDAADRLIATTDSMDQRIVLGRDEKGRLTSKAFPDGAATTFEYDSLGNLASAINEECVVAFERDPIGRILKELQGDEWVTMEYDAAGNLVRNITSKGFEVNYKYDANGRTVELATHDGHTVAFNRNAYGEETSRLLPGKRTRLDREYDSVGHMIEQRLHVLPEDVSYALTLSGDLPDGTNYAAAISRSYRYDKNGSLLSIDDGFWGKTENVYDPAQRLIKTIHTLGENELFAYDSTGNIVSKTSGSREIQNSYGAGNQLQNAGDTKYEYDGNGRRIRKIVNASTQSPQHWIYTWDGNGRLASVTRPDGSVWRYLYDALGRRLSKKGPHAEERFVWCGNVVIHHIIDDTEPITWLFEQGSFRPLCKIENGKWYSVINDHLGTPRELVNEDGHIVWSGMHKAWGIIEKTDVAEVNCQIRFQGQWFDEESGLCYNRFRYYDGETGQFISKDPIGLSGGANEYRYVRNPVNWVDPAGLTDAPAIQPYEVTTFEDFRRRSVPGDNLEGHEVLQHANLNERGLATTRLSTDASKENPVIALPHDVHVEVNREQRELSPRQQTGEENIDSNIEILRRNSSVPEDAIDDIEQRAKEHNESLEDDSC